MKLKQITIIISLFLIIGSAYSQQSLSEVAKSWTTGDFDEYKYNKESSKFESTGQKTKLGVAKYENGEVAYFVYNKESYKFIDKEQTTFVRSYRNSVGQQMHITEKSVIIYNASQTIPQTVTLIACIGKKPSGKIQSEIENYLTATKNEFIPEYAGNLDDYIDSIRVKTMFRSPGSDKDDNLDVGVTIWFKWGKYSKTENLGGKMYSRSLTYSSPGLQYFSVGDEKFPFRFNCKLEPSDEVYFEVKTKSTNEKKYHCKTELTCNASGSVSIERIRRWSDYDQIGFAYYDKDLRMKTYVLENQNKAGYGSYSNEINKMYRKVEPKFRLVRVKKNGKFGYADSTGVVVIPIEYDEAEVGHFEEKLIPVKKGGKWGLINEKNKVILNYEYEKINTFYNGLAVVMKDGKYGAINTAGKIVHPVVYEMIGNFTTYDVAIASKDGKYGLLSKDGKIVVPLEKEKVSDINSNNFFKLKEGPKYGIIDSDGKIILAAEYEEINAFSEGYARIMKNSLYAYFSYKGAFITDFKYDVAADFNGFYAKVQVHESNGVSMKISKGSVNTDGIETWEEGKSPSNVSVTSSQTKNTKSDVKESKTCTIVNDLKPDQVNKYNDVRLVFDNYSIVAKSLARGKSMEVDCDDVVVWLGEFNDQNGSKKTRKLFETKGQCGKVIKLSDFWK